MDNLLDLVKGLPSHRKMAKRAKEVFDQSDRFVVKGDRSKEGSRGGHVIGHTFSGKPIYQSHQHNDIHGQKPAHAEKHGNFDQHYADYKPGDHIDAQHHHLDQSRKHHDAAESLSKEGKHDEASEHTKAAGYHQAQIDAHSYAKLGKLNQHTPASRAVGHSAVDLKAAQHATKMDKKLPKGASKAPLAEARKYIRNEGKHGTPEFERSLDDNPDLVKGGKEGSRGGRVIGHTSSGKPIYATRGLWPKRTSGHSHQDHADAGAAHLKLSDHHMGEGNKFRREGNKAAAEAQWAIASHHAEMNEAHSKEYSRKHAKEQKEYAHFRRQDVEAAFSRKSLDDNPDLVKGRAHKYIRKIGSGSNATYIYTHAQAKAHDPDAHATGTAKEFHEGQAKQHGDLVEHHKKRLDASMKVYEGIRKEGPTPGWGELGTARHWGAAVQGHRDDMKHHIKVKQAHTDLANESEKPDMTERHKWSMALQQVAGQLAYDQDLKGLVDKISFADINETSFDHKHQATIGIGKGLPNEYGYHTGASHRGSLNIDVGSDGGSFTVMDGGKIHASGTFKVGGNIKPVQEKLKAAILSIPNLMEKPDKGIGPAAAMASGSWGQYTDGFGQKTHRLPGPGGTTLEVVEETDSRYGKKRFQPWVREAQGGRNHPFKMVSSVAEAKKVAEAEAKKVIGGEGFGRPEQGLERTDRSITRDDAGNARTIESYYDPKEGNYIAVIRSGAKGGGEVRARSFSDASAQTAAIAKLGAETAEAEHYADVEAKQAKRLEIKERRQAKISARKSGDNPKAKKSVDDNHDLMKAIVAYDDRLEKMMSNAPITKNELTAAGRKRIKINNFALSGRRYPIHDIEHARNALSRVAQHGTPEEIKTVRRAVHAKYPTLAQPE